MMIFSLIINILALIGTLTLALIALALWAYVSDEETFESFPIMDMTEIPLEELSPSIPTMTEVEK